MAEAVWSDAEIASATPMTARCLTIKTQNPDGVQFHRMGEVYAMADAELAAKALFIHCTTRGTHAGQAWSRAGSTHRPSHSPPVLRASLPCTPAPCTDHPLGRGERRARSSAARISR